MLPAHWAALSAADADADISVYRPPYDISSSKAARPSSALQAQAAATREAVIKVRFVMDTCC